jgi:hypothetical protein
VELDPEDRRTGPSAGRDQQHAGPAGGRA